MYNKTYEDFINSKEFKALWTLARAVGLDIVTRENHDPSKTLDGHTIQYSVEVKDPKNPKEEIFGTVFVEGSEAHGGYKELIHEFIGIIFIYGEEVTETVVWQRILNVAKDIVKGERAEKKAHKKK